MTVKSCQIGLKRKDIILPSNAAVILYKWDLRTGIEDSRITFTKSAGTYYIDDFNAEVKVAVLQHR